MYALFAAPPDRDLDWQEEGVAGISRFLARVYRLTMKFAPVVRSLEQHIHGDEIAPAAFAGQTPHGAALLRKLHQTIAKITDDFSGRWHFNTCIAAIMILVNEILAAEAALDAGDISPATIAELLRSLTLLLAPFAPFLAAELWQQLGHTSAASSRSPGPSPTPNSPARPRSKSPCRSTANSSPSSRSPRTPMKRPSKPPSLADAKVAARLEGKTIVKHLVIDKPPASSSTSW